MGSLQIQKQQYNYDLLTIDGDAIVYRAGFTVKEDEPFSHAIHACRLILDNIRDACPANTELMYLTSNDKSNFRFARAKTPRLIKTRTEGMVELLGYKANRKAATKPHYYNEIREWLEKEEGAIVVFGEEADDAMARSATECTGKAIIATHDKDLNMVPVDIYDICKRSINPYHVRLHGEIGYLIPQAKKLYGRGLTFFYAQMLMGDTGDNIPGISGYGPKRTYEVLKDCETEQALFDVTWDIYKENTEDSKNRYLEIADLLFMRGTCNIENMGLYLESKYNFTGE